MKRGLFDVSSMASTASIEYVEKILNPFNGTLWWHAFIVWN